MIKAIEMLKELKTGKVLTLKDFQGKNFQVKYAIDKYDLVQGLQMFRESKKISDVAMKDHEMINYLSQFEKL